MLACSIQLSKQVSVHGNIIKPQTIDNVRSLIKKNSHAVSAHDYYHVQLSCHLQIYFHYNHTFQQHNQTKLISFHDLSKKRKRVTNGSSVFIYLFVCFQVFDNFIKFVFHIFTLPTTIPRPIPPIPPILLCVHYLTCIHQVQFVMPISSCMEMQSSTNHS